MGKGADYWNPQTINQQVTKDVVSNITGATVSQATSNATQEKLKKMENKLQALLKE